MAEIKAGPHAVGITSKTPPAPTKPTIQKTPEQQLQDARYLQGYEKGKHDKGHTTFWQGMGLAYLSMVIALIFVSFYSMWNDNDERAKRFLTAREIEHMKLIEGNKFPVADPGSK